MTLPYSTDLGMGEFSCVLEYFSNAKITQLDVGYLASNAAELLAAVKKHILGLQSEPVQKPMEMHCSNRGMMLGAIWFVDESEF